MTSIMHPGTYARIHATNASQALKAASQALRGPGEGMVGIPERSGPDTPDNPWFVDPAERILDNGLVARAQSSIALKELTAALSVSRELSSGVVTALTNAQEQATAGHTMLVNPPTDVRIDRNNIALQFDAGSMWADLAVQLIDLDMRGGRPTPGPGGELPPVTILPVPEVEAPEAMAH
ncbi:MAG: hypothetical protein KDC46_02460 [Thermoleophilia bacterium]|nr:hypothetical protein [Thermoleophilia bacterium]